MSSYFNMCVGKLLNMGQGLMALDVRATKLGRAAASGICDTHKPHGF